MLYGEINLLDTVQPYLRRHPSTLDFDAIKVGQRRSTSSSGRCRPVSEGK